MHFLDLSNSLTAKTKNFVNSNPKTIKVLVEICRIIVGFTFIFSGLVKAIDPMGSAIKISDYLIAFHLDGLTDWATLFSINLCGVEFTIGACVLLGCYRNIFSLLALTMMSFMTPLTLYLALFNPVSDCGCFGDFIILTNWQTFGKNIVLLSATLFLHRYNQLQVKLYSFKSYWFITLLSFILCIVFASINYRHLPPIDFRPFKVGVNIPSLIQLPPNAAQDVFEYKFIYEKNNQRKTFGLEDSPSNDSTWTFVESKSILKKKGDLPAVMNFQLYNDKDIDLAHQLLEDTTNLFLLIIPDVDKADDFLCTENINMLYTQTQKKGELFYAVIGSDEESYMRWIKKTGAEYPHLSADKILLETIIRSNPGLVWIRKGTIQGKWGFRDIPNVRNLATSIPSTQMYKWLGVVYLLLLLLVAIYDWTRKENKNLDKE